MAPRAFYIAHTPLLKLVRHTNSQRYVVQHTHEHANRARLYECLLLWGVQHARKYIIMLFMHRQVFHRIPALYVLLLLAGWLAA